MIEAKWLTSSIYRYDEVGTEYLSTGYANIIDNMYRDFRLIGVEQPVFDNVELIYILRSMNSACFIEWGVRYMNNWYISR